MVICKILKHLRFREKNSSYKGKSKTIESDINKTLIKIGKIDRNSLVEFFNKYKSISFHKLFPQLDINFTIFTIILVVTLQETD